MSFELPKLPYAKNALEPYISEETVEYHYSKHHQTYVTNLNKLIIDSPFANKDLVEIIRQTDGPIFNNAAQVWNHTFYWHCLSANGGGAPKGALYDAIINNFGSFDQFKELFSKAAIAQFGSGWTWLTKDVDGSLSIISTSNADTPLKHQQNALLTCDVWEHAYYIDYRNVRSKYIEAFWNVVNWDFVAENFAHD